MKKDNKMTYEQAISRIEEITRKVESGEMDIDSLANSLKEAKELVQFCKEKLTKVEADVKKILDE
ncbi:MAG: exodeoxyribonuclease VII small subunit [Bacteroidaceae bacterium]|nr:exodeoxyribonuclease VII small subunit [Bacteroidaceae bacterium]